MTFTKRLLCGLQRKEANNNNNKWQHIARWLYSITITETEGGQNNNGFKKQSENVWASL